MVIRPGYGDPQPEDPAAGGAQQLHDRQHELLTALLDAWQTEVDLKRQTIRLLPPMVQRHLLAVTARLDQIEAAVREARVWTVRDRGGRDDNGRPP
jgi:hypothetical protein